MTDNGPVFTAGGGTSGAPESERSPDLSDRAGKPARELDSLMSDAMLIASGSPDAPSPTDAGTLPPVQFPDTRFGRFDRRYTTFTKWLSYLAGIALLSVVVVCVIDVVGWKLFGKSVPSSVDFIKFMNVALVFLAVAYVQTDRGSTAIEMGQDHFPRWLKLGVRMFAYFLGFAVCLYVVYRGYFYFEKMIDNKQTASGVWKFPLWPFQLCLMIGMFFLGWGFVVTGIRDFITFKNRTGRYAPSKKGLA